MRAATRLIIALLLFVGLSGCRTAKKATIKEEASQELAASFVQDQQTTTTGAASFDQAIAEQIRKHLNIVINFKRWEYDPTEEPATTPGSGEVIIYEVGGETDKPPNIPSRPKSYTEGSVIIKDEGEREITTQTAAAAQVQKTDDIKTEAAIDILEEAKADIKTEEKPKTGLGFWDIVFMIFFGVAVLGAVILAIKIGRSLKK